MFVGNSYDLEFRIASNQRFLFGNELARPYECKRVPDMIIEQSAVDHGLRKLSAKSAFTVARAQTRAERRVWRCERLRVAPHVGNSLCEKHGIAHLHKLARLDGATREGSDVRPPFFLVRVEKFVARITLAHRRQLPREIRCI